MFDKGKREQRHEKEDAAFNKMLLWLAGAVVVELIILLVKQVYVNMLLGPGVATVLMYFFQVFSILGVVLAVGGIAWAVLWNKKGKPVVLPCALTAAAAGLWVLSLFTYQLFDVGLNIVMLLPAVAAVLIVIFFLYQRVFFLNALLCAGGLLALWRHRQYYEAHHTMVTALFIAGLQETADQVPRDGDGLFAVPRDEIFAASTSVYDNLSRRFPFLEREDRVPKRMFFSRLFSAMNFTGFYSPYTGESSLNVDSPVCLLPANIAHELAHQRGIASEQECNFLAIAAATSSDDPAYQYSGYLMGYIHLSNALYRADQDRWRAVTAGLPEPARADLRCHSAYWAQFEGPAATVSKAIYDSSLKSYGQTDGIQSYGTVVDLLVAYY